jgi:hypothetical protein
MGLADACDHWIVEHVDDVCLTLHLLTGMAPEKGDLDWPVRHEWWRRVGYRLRNDLPGPALDG